MQALHHDAGELIMRGRLRHVMPQLFCPIRVGKSTLPIKLKLFSHQVFDFLSLHWSMITKIAGLSKKWSRLKKGEIRKLVFIDMNIESSKAALMPVAYQAPTPPKAAEPTPAPAPALAPARERKDEPLNQSAMLELENRKRIAVVEKAMGMNKSVIVEKDKQRVGFVYKTVDTSTGEVTRVWPQREVSSALMALADSDARSMMLGMMVDHLA
jgi:hypothetical protein